MSFEHTTTNYEPLSAEINEIAKKTVDAAYKVHMNLGPGLLENVYEECLIHELTKKGLLVESQIYVPIDYDGVRLKGGLRLDLLVEKKVVGELKTVEVLMPVHKAQLLTYLKLTGHRLGLLINFDAGIFKDGIKRVIL
jgi:GxxExxY protein